MRLICDIQYYVHVINNYSLYNDHQIYILKIYFMCKYYACAFNKYIVKVRNQLVQWYLYVLQKLV